MQSLLESGPLPGNFTDVFMIDLQPVTKAVLRRAEGQGFVLPKEIKEELTQAGLAETDWEAVVAQAGASLRFEKGRYYFVRSASKMLARLHADQKQSQEIQKAVQGLIAQREADLAINVERRAHRRMEFFNAVEAQKEKGGKLKLISREISISGIRLLAAEPLAGQKIKLWIPLAETSEERWCFQVQILWSAPIADNLHESGGIFLAVEKA